MPDVLNENGLETKTLTELITQFEDALKLIYGSDINIEQNSPDGQMINIYSQEGRDLRELLEQVNASFDTDQAEGRVLDQRVAINGIKRLVGSYTTVNIEVTIDRALNLIGLDLQSEELNPTVENLYTVRDDEGNLFYLQDSQSEAGAGTYTYIFRAAIIGNVEIQVNTITTPVTIIAGVTGINNPAGALIQGADEELDPALKIRRRKSTAISSEGFVDGLQGVILNLDGVTAAIVNENDTNITDSEGTPAHTIWTIVEGGDDTEIAEAIKAKKTSGAGMRGDEIVTLNYNDGRPVDIKFDRSIGQDLYIRFTLVLPGGVIDPDEIKRLIVENVIWEVGKDAVGSIVTCYVQSLNSNYQVTGMEISDDGASWVEVVSTTNSQYKFINDVTRITIS